MKVRIRLLSFLIFLNLALDSVLTKAAAGGPQRLQSEIGTPTSFAFFDANRIGSWISNRGELVSDEPRGNSGMSWPRGTRKTINYQAGLWLAGKVLGNIRTAAAEFSSEFTPGTYSGAPDNQSDPLFRIYVIDRHSGPGETDYDEWPVQDGAPVDSNGNPLLLGDKTYWSVFNDVDTTNHIFGLQPLGVEVRQTIWAYDRIGVFGDMMFVNWQIYNKSPETIDSMYFAFWDDADVGAAHNVLMGCMPEINFGYAYNDGPDPVYGVRAPAIGFDLLQSPIVSSPGDTASSFGMLIPGHRNISMSAFSKIINAGGSADSDPRDKTGVWNRMTGLLTDGTPIVNPLTSDTTTFQYTGDPVSGTGWLDPEGHNSRFIMPFGPFTMAAGDSQEVIGGFLVAQGEDHLSSITELRNAAATLQSVFDNRFRTHEVALLSPLGGEILSETDTVRWAASSQVSDSIFADIYIIPFKGDLIRIAEGEMNDSSYLWNTTLVPDGIYSMAIEVSNDNTLPAIDWSDTTFIVDNIENGAPSILFDKNPTHTPQSEILLLWTALDPENDTLDISLQYKFTWNNPWETVADEIPNTGEYFWNTYEFPNNIITYIRLIVSDGEFSDTTSTKRVSIKNNRLAVLDSVFTNVIGAGNKFEVNIVDSADITGHDYIVTFGDSRLEYSIKDSQTSEIVLPDGVLEHWLLETPLFDGIRLNIGTASMPGLNKALWKTVTSDTSTYRPFLDVGFRGEENQADYEVRFSSVDNDTTRIGDLIVPFQVWNVSNSPDTKVILDYFGTSTVWRSGLKLNFYESDLGRITWELQFYWNEFDLPPQDGDVLLLKTLFPHNAGDLLLFNTNGAPIVGIDNNASSFPIEFNLAQNYPNPFNPLTNIQYSLPVRSEVKLIIYNLRGQEVVRLVDGEERPAGVHNAVWDASTAASGIYFYRLQAGNFVQTRKMVFLK